MAIGSWSPAAFASEWVTVKYRETPVDVSEMSALDRSGGDVRQAWYDVGNQYLVINLTGTNYHYCGVSSRQWRALSAAPDLEAHYRQNFYEGDNDCRVVGTVPAYPRTADTNAARSEANPMSAASVASSRAEPSAAAPVEADDAEEPDDTIGVLIAGAIVLGFGVVTIRSYLEGLRGEVSTRSAPRHRTRPPTSADRTKSAAGSPPKADGRKLTTLDRVVVTVREGHQIQTRERSISQLTGLRGALLHVFDHLFGDLSTDA